MSAEPEKPEPKVQAEDNSVAVGSFQVGGNVEGSIHIGHTIGYTVEQVSTLIQQISSTFEPKKFDGRSPYKGLDVFEEEDAGLFFGREKIVADLVGRLKESRTLFITGPSGSGKSSLVRAGLIYALKQGAIKNSQYWLYGKLKPGREPIEALATVFSRMKSPELGEYFLEHIDQPNILHKCAESVLSERDDQRLLLFIDQFEEIFTQAIKETERTKFLDLLTQALENKKGRITLLFAMRSDFILNCALYPRLNALINQQFVQIGSMQPNELVSAIAQPAMHVDLKIDINLIIQIINDMHGEPGTLPLMQFAMKDLFEAEKLKGTLIALTRDAYLQRGGLHKSLERHADASFAELDMNEQELAHTIFSGLIEIGHGTQDTRRTALFEELVPGSSNPDNVRAVIQKLANSRLITTDSIRSNNKLDKEIITLAHEKLIEVWPFLSKLVNENREVIALKNQVAEDLQEWENHGHDISYLYSGMRLAAVREKIKENELSEKAQAFIKASIYAQNENRRTSDGLRAIYELTSTLTATLSYKSVLDSALDQGVSALSPSSDQDEQIVVDEQLVGAILLFQGSKLRVASAKRFTNRDMQINLLGNEGILKKVIENGEAVLTSNVGNDPELVQIFALHSCSSAYFLPLRSGFNVYGVMLFAHPDPNCFTQERCSLIDIIGQQSVIAIQNARLYQDLVEEKERMIEVQEETRKKLARDLHDGPTQSVAAIAIRINLARRMMKKDTKMAEEELLKTEELARRTTKEVRHLLFTLRPLILESQGLPAALDALAEKMHETFSQNVIINVEENISENMEMGKQGVIFYIIEEAVNNARKHAIAFHIWVRLRNFETNIALLEIEDDGIGFDVEAVNKSYDNRGSLGIINLRERTELINGLLNIDSAPGKGTRIQVYIPLSDEAADRLHHKKL